ncbi:hypothetical protein LCGC14_2223500 [marine sediment metagenome]|uniref:Uncharacterized protein n=1 Tax=marine sediment metagenome TaxID=412755 RepID=A0A0F9DAB3_9ZZZZ
MKKLSRIENLLIIGRGAKENIGKINDWIKKNCNISNAFNEISQYSGGDKSMEMEILASAINYFDRDLRMLSFFDFLRNLEWDFDIDLFLMIEGFDTLERTRIYKNKY